MARNRFSRREGTTIDQLELFFLNGIFPGITACSKPGEGLPLSMAILTCCAIDVLALYYSGDPGTRLNKRKYVAFLNSYFPNYQPAEEFYEFVRCGLVHSFDMGGQYLIINSEDEWAQAIHMKFDPQYDAWILNTHTLFRDLKKAHRRFVAQARNDKKLAQKIEIVQASKPLKRQILRRGATNPLARTVALQEAGLYEYFSSLPEHQRLRYARRVDDAKKDRDLQAKYIKEMIKNLRTSQRTGEHP